MVNRYRVGMSSDPAGQNHETQTIVVESTQSDRVGFYKPLVLCLTYLGGTYVAFLLVGPSERATNLPLVSVFIAATLLALSTGYVAQVRRFTGWQLPKLSGIAVDKVPVRLISAGACYYLVLGFAYVSLYRTPGIAGLITSIASPGDAYFARLRHGNEFGTSSVIQLLTLTGALYAALIPLAVTYWSRLVLPLRLLVVAGLTAYALYYLSIGTLKGLGDMFIFWGASYLLLSEHNRRVTSGAVTRSYRRAGTVAVAVLLLAYVSFNQGDRLRSASQAAAFPGNPIVADIVGDRFASGLAVTAFYPTHGYLGLSYNLEMPFQWTMGWGGSPALGSYLEQYFGIDGQFANRYTARTEFRTGYPDGMLWSTIYPWLASDLTFPGAVLFMGIVGWFLAKFWLEGLTRRRKLSIVLFCQLALLIVFVPANNQIGQGRLSLIAFVSLAGLSIVQRLRHARSGGRTIGLPRPGCADP
jgi:hypothetical protein